MPLFLSIFLTDHNSQPSCRCFCPARDWRPVSGELQDGSKWQPAGHPDTQFKFQILPRNCAFCWAVLWPLLAPISANQRRSFTQQTNERRFEVKMKLRGWRSSGEDRRDETRSRREWRRFLAASLISCGGDKIHDKSKIWHSFLLHSYSHAEVRYEEMIFDSGVSKKKSVTRSPCLHLLLPWNVGE